MIRAPAKRKIKSYSCVQLKNASLNVQYHSCFKWGLEIFLVFFLVVSFLVSSVFFSFYFIIVYQFKLN